MASWRYLLPEVWTGDELLVTNLNQEGFSKVKYVIIHLSTCGGARGKHMFYLKRRSLLGTRITQRVDTSSHQVSPNVGPEAPCCDVCFMDPNEAIDSLIQVRRFAPGFCLWQLLCFSLKWALAMRERNWAGLSSNETRFRSKGEGGLR